MSRPIRFLSVALVAAVAAAVILWPRFGSDGGGGRPAPSAPAEGGPLAVDVVRVEPRRLEERLATTGTVRAGERVEVVAEIAGKVVEIAFAEGGRVGAGDLLVAIDDTALAAEHRRAVSLAELARLRERRQRELREQGVVSEQEYDVVANEMAVLEAELALAASRLEKTEIRAPFAGVVGLRRVSEGSYLTPQTVITTLQALDPVKLDFTVPEQYAARVAAGDRVTFRVKGDPRDHRATIYAIEPTVEPATRSLVVRARAPNSGRTLTPGAFADVELVVAEDDAALVVPSLAVIPELGGKKVFVVEDGVARERPVETGIRTDTDVQITSGVAPGDRVIVTAIQRLREGLEVAPREGE